MEKIVEKLDGLPSCAADCDIATLLGNNNTPPYLCQEQNHLLIREDKYRSIAFVGDYFSRGQTMNDYFSHKDS